MGGGKLPVCLDGRRPCHCVPGHQKTRHAQYECFQDGGSKMAAVQSWSPLTPYFSGSASDADMRSSQFGFYIPLDGSLRYPVRIHPKAKKLEVRHFESAILRKLKFVENLFGAHKKYEKKYFQDGGSKMAALLCVSIIYLGNYMR